MAAKQKWPFIVTAGLLITSCSSSWKAPVYSNSTSLNQRAPVQTYSYVPGSRYYQVQPGDTLYGIAWQTGSNFDDLVRWNRITRPDTIYAGQKLLVKAPAYSKTVKPKSHSKPVTTDPVKQPSTKTKSISSKPAPASNEKFPATLRWKWPVSGRIIEGFSYGDDTKKGVMLAGNIGDPIMAAESGKVVYSGSGLIGYGKLIIIKHNNNYLSAYGFNDRLFVKEGAWITKGEKIALMGQSDKGVPALHFEIRKNGSPVDPVKLLPRRN
jgi:lipoprotein NlpD